jgi:uncharacterized delta-60 repeat protein
MSMRYKGGVISATPPTTSTSAATGVWTLVQQLQAQGAGTWPVPIPYWIGLLGSGNTDIGNSVAVDSSGNMYLCGYTNASGTNDIQIAKYNTSGVIQWQRTLGGNGNTNRGYSITVDSSSNVYLCGGSFVGVSNDIQIAKYNTSGTIQWQRRLSNSSGQDLGNSVAVDSSGNVYIFGYSNQSGTTDCQIAKYDTSGTIQWQRTLSGGTEIGYSVAVDSSGNSYVCGYTSFGVSGTWGFIIAKYNTSGTIQWQRRLDSSGQDYGYSVAVDSSGNVYVCGQSNASGTDDIQIAKYDTSGTIQWQRTLGGGASDVGYSIAVDSSSNVYVCGYSNASGTVDIQIAKYNTSGTIQWQRSLGSSSTDIGNSVAVDSSGNVYLCGYTSVSGNSYFLFAKLPGNGGFTGTYTVGGYSFTYAASSLTDATSSLTDAASSLTDAASSLTSSTSTLTDAASTLTSSVTTL